jgi:hypothetical protein
MSIINLNCRTLTTLNRLEYSVWCCISSHSPHFKQPNFLWLSYDYPITFSRTCSHWTWYQILYILFKLTSNCHERSGNPTSSSLKDMLHKQNNAYLKKTRPPMTTFSIECREKFFYVSEQIMKWDQIARGS